jgi:hypothetical protein
MSAKCFGRGDGSNLLPDAAVASQALLPPSNHPFWKRADAPAAALLATTAIERERQAAVSSLETAMSRLTGLTQAMYKAESEAKAAREAAARDSAAREAAESALAARTADVVGLQARLKAAYAGARAGAPRAAGAGGGEGDAAPPPLSKSSTAANAGAHPEEPPRAQEAPRPESPTSQAGTSRLAAAAPSAVATLLQRENERLKQSLLQATVRAKRAEAKLAQAPPGQQAGAPAPAPAAPVVLQPLQRSGSAGASGRTDAVSAAALAVAQAAAAEANAAAAAARAEAATLRDALAVERARARGAAAAAQAASADATAARAAAFVAAGGSTGSGGAASRLVDIDALRVDLLEERLRSRELAATLAAERGAAGHNPASQPSSSSAETPSAELLRLRERVRSLQASLDAAEARGRDLEAELDSLTRAPSPLTLQSRFSAGGVAWARG